MATYHGITKAICLNCGKLTTDETQLEILNDLDPTCAVCDVHAVAWHTSKGVVVTAQKTTEEDSETERFAILESVKKNQTRFTYDLAVRFSTDRELTEDEKGTLQHQVIAQIDEPVSAEGEDVTYTTKFYGSDIDEVKGSN